MKPSNTRRDFIKLSLLTGGLAPCLGNVLFAEEQADPCEEKMKNAVQKMRDRELVEQIKLIKKLVEKYGKGLIDVIKQHTIDETSNRYQEAKIPKRDLEAVKKYLWDALDSNRFQFVKVKDTPEYLEFKVTRCLLAEIAKQIDGGEIGFALNCAWDYGFCRGLNPEIKFTRTKTLMMGDDCCNHTYRLPKA